MRFVDLFCGIGGFRLGLERANDSTQEGIQQRIRQRSGRNTTTKQSLVGTKQFACVWSCDIDKYARQIYEKNFGEEPEGKDIRAIRPEEIPDAELYTFGWPCQDNSIAGKRKGQALDTRSGLLFEAVRIIRAKKPDYFIAENVKGLYSVNEGIDYIQTIRMLTYLNDSLPQYSLQCQLLNTRWFLPQNRERIFFIGHLREGRRPEVFPIGEGNEVFEKKNRGKQRGRQRISSTIDSRYGALRNAGETYVIQDKRQSGEFRIKDKPCVTANYGLGGRNVPMVANAVDCDGYLRKGERPRDKNGKPQLLPIGYRRIRRLTPVECERLQGFPDNWTQGVSDTQRYKLLGNAVTVNVIEFLGRLLIEESGKVDQ